MFPDNLCFLRESVRAHLVAEPETGLITDEQVTMAAGPDNSDAAVAARVTEVPLGTVTEQVVPQSMPPPVTVPEPEPAFPTVRA